MTTVPSYADAEAPADHRVGDLLDRMTDEEKVAQLGCVWVTSLMTGSRFDPSKAAAGIPYGIGEVTRIAASTGLKPVETAALMNEIQEFATQGTRLGIPVLVHEEATGGYCARDATVFPQGIGLASTWDPALVGEVAGAIREEMIAVGARHALAPVLDIARDPRWGRVEETYGEDPVLAAAMGVAFVRNLQNHNLGQGVLATGKHFLGHALPEGGRNHGPIQIGPRELWEVYAEPFAAAIRDAGLATVMNSYSALDGLPPAASAAVLNKLLREELGFGGAVVADYYSLRLLIVHHHVAADEREAATRAINAGMDMELPSVDCFGPSLLEAIASGDVSRDVMNEAVRRVLAMKMALGLFERPYVDASQAPLRINTDDHRQLARRAAEEAVILLTNDGILPLRSDLSRVALLGPGASDRRLLEGDYHYPAHIEPLYLAGVATTPDPTIQDVLTAFQPMPDEGGADAGPHFPDGQTIEEAIRDRLSADAELECVRGCGLSCEDDTDMEAAVAAASWADVAIVVVAGRSGIHSTSTVGEARDAQDLDLVGRQGELISRVVVTGTPTVVVVLSGRVHTLEDAARDANALLQMWPPGEEGGPALSAILFGDVIPAGRLPVTLPRRVGQIPVYGGQRNGGQSSMFYGAYTDGPTSPLFAFGHGLSYANFAYGPLEVIEEGDTDRPTRLQVTVRNESDVTADEVVQLYASDVVASTVRPRQQLIGFVRTPVPAQQQIAVTFTVHPSRLAYVDEDLEWVTEPGEFKFGVGGGSDRIATTLSLSLSGPPARWLQREIVSTAAEVSPAW